MSILDKIKVIWNTIINSNELKYIIPFLGVVLLVVIVSFFVNKAKYHKVYLLVYVFTPPARCSTRSATGRSRSGAARRSIPASAI